MPKKLEVARPTKKLEVARKPNRTILATSKLGLYENRIFFQLLSKYRMGETVPGEVFQLDAEWIFGYKDPSPRQWELCKEAAESICRQIITETNEEDTKHSVYAIVDHCDVERKKDGTKIIEASLSHHVFPVLEKMLKEGYTPIAMAYMGRLASSYSIRIYEILLTRWNRGDDTLEISVHDLRTLLGINKKVYSKFADFRKSILEVPQKELREKTNISFEFETKWGLGARKITEIIFTISENEPSADSQQLSLKLEPPTTDSDTEKARKIIEDRLDAGSKTRNTIREKLDKGEIPAKRILWAQKTVKEKEAQGSIRNPSGIFVILLGPSSDNQWQDYCQKEEAKIAAASIARKKPDEDRMRKEKEAIIEAEWNKLDKLTQDFFISEALKSVPDVIKKNPGLVLSQAQTLFAEDLGF